MSIWILILLCVVQGLTEFLPVSSSGHLLLIENLFNIDSNILLLNLFLHLATLCAVVIVYRKIILDLIKHPFQKLTLKLLISTVITVIFALFYELFGLDKVLNGYLGYYFLATGLLLILTYVFKVKTACVTKSEVSMKDSFVVGAVQGLAVLPGISRSGSTISTLLFLGNNEGVSAQYSFLLSISIIIGGFLFEIVKIDDYSNIFSNFNVFVYLFAFFLTFLVSWLSLKLTIKALKKNKFIFFGVYLVLLGLVVLFAL